MSDDDTPKSIRQLRDEYVAKNTRPKPPQKVGNVERFDMSKPDYKSVTVAGMESKYGRKPE